MNKRKAIELKKLFFEQEGISYEKATKKLIKSSALKKAWRKFKKENQYE